MCGETRVKRIELDFYQRSAMHKTALGWALLAIGLVVGVGLVIYHNKLKSEQQLIQMNLAQQYERQRESSSNMDIKVIETQLQQASEVIDQLSFPWNRLFRALESSVNEDVALLSIQPDVVGRIVTLNAEARNWNAMLKYASRLGKDKFFTDVHLVSHQIQQGNPQSPVRFILSCAWGSPQTPTSH